MLKEDELEKNIEYWKKNQKKWYHIYFFAGIGINFILYFTKPGGFDPSGSILWGSIFGIGIPLATMLVCAYIHQKMLGL